jgi:hypothetical protein
MKEQWNPMENTFFSRGWCISHSVISMQKFLKVNMAVQWSNAVWLPYLLDLNLLDYCIWCMLPVKANTAAHHPNLESRGQTTLQEWGCLS